MPFVPEASEPTQASHLQGGILVNFRQRRVASLTNITRRVYERNGWRQVAEGRVGVGKWHCECQEPCGFRAFPAVPRLRDLAWSDCYELLKRAGWTAQNFEGFERFVYERKKENDRFRRAGLLRKNDMVFLGRLPGPLVRGLCHDFPAEFSTVQGGTVDFQHKHLEKVLGDLFVMKCWRPAGAAP